MMFAPETIEKVSIRHLEANQFSRKIDTGAEIEVMFYTLVDAYIRNASTAIALDIPSDFINVRCS
mgnify:CR=1 FL=1